MMLSLNRWIRAGCAGAMIAIAAQAGHSEPAVQRTTAEAITALPAGAAVDNKFWQTRREGWFWYRDPTAAIKAPPAIPTPLAGSAPQVPRSTNAPTPALPERSVKDIEEFENFQFKLESLRKVAIINPTPQNVREYMVHERMAYKQATVFAQVQQTLNWVDPVFAEQSADLRPVNSTAMRVWDQQRIESKRAFVARLAKTHGLYLFLRSDCAYCHVFSPLIKRFGQQTGMTVFPVTLDGGGNADFPTPVPDNGMAARLGIKIVPALVLAEPSMRDFQVLSFGVLSEEEILDRIYALMNERRAMAGPGRLQAQ
jgi:conjugal transfer pilus assembly protein TraF